MEKKLSGLSIFFPFWNEEKNIESVVESAIPIAKEGAHKWEIIVVDDGSRDKTLERAEALAKKYNNIRVVSHTPNRGYGAALQEGFSNSKYEYIVFTDGDGQFDFAEVKRFIEKIGKNDVVIGYREKRQDSFKRTILMTLLKIWDWLFFRFYFKDIDCGFKMFTKEAVEAIMPLRSEGAMITTEILAKAKKKKLKIAQVGVTHYPRKFGKQSGAHMSVIIRAMLETFILWWDVHNQRF